MTCSSLNSIKIILFIFFFILFFHQAVEAGGAIPHLALNGAKLLIENRTLTTIHNSLPVLGRSITTIGKKVGITNQTDKFIERGQRAFRKNCNTFNKVANKMPNMGDSGKDRQKKSSAATDIQRGLTFSPIKENVKLNTIKMQKELPKMEEIIGMRRKFGLNSRNISLPDYSNKTDQEKPIENINNIGQTFGAQEFSKIQSSKDNTLADLTKKRHFSRKMFYEKYYGQNGLEEYDENMSKIINTAPAA